MDCGTYWSSCFRENCLLQIWQDLQFGDVFGRLGAVTLRVGTLWSGPSNSKPVVAPLSWASCCKPSEGSIEIRPRANVSARGGELLPLLSSSIGSTSSVGSNWGKVRSECDGNVNSGNGSANKSWVPRINGSAKSEEGSQGKESKEGARISAATVTTSVPEAASSKDASASWHLAGRPSVAFSCSLSKYCGTLVSRQLSCGILESDIHLCNLLYNFENPEERKSRRKQGWIVGERKLRRTTLI